MRRLAYAGVLLLLAALTAYLALASARPVAAISTADGQAERPTTWVPTDVYSQIYNNAPGAGFSLYMGWKGPESTRNLGGTAPSQGTFEIGWKDVAATDSCGDLNRARYAGFPAGMDVRWDYTEDGEDMVLWMADLHLLAADQKQDLNKLYNASGTCGSDQGYFTGSSTQRPYFQVQLGHWTNEVKDPISTFSDASLNLVPAEQGNKAFVKQPGFEDDTVYTTQILNAWNRDNSFEGDDPAWQAQQGSKTRICQNTSAPALAGNCYVYMHPQTLGTTRTTWLNQSFQVATKTDSGGDGYATPYQMGNNTGLQLEGGFRCPVNSPRDSRQNTAYCLVTTWLKSDAASSWQTRDLYVPNDGRWYFGMWDDFAAQASSAGLQVWIDTHGYPMDVDNVWVSSGI